MMIKVFATIIVVIAVSLAVVAVASIGVMIAVFVKTRGP